MGDKTELRGQIKIRKLKRGAAVMGVAAALSPLQLLLLPARPSSSPPPLPRIPRRCSSSLSSSASSSSSSSSSCSSLSRRTHRFFPTLLSLPISSSPPSHLLCRAAEYKFPDPIPEFADAETDKFRTHMLARLTEKNQYFGDFTEEIVDICTEILSNFLHAEYGGPGTLLVIPFIDMADTIREKGLPGAPQAARAAVWWSEKHIDKDWKEWTGFRD